MIEGGKDIEKVRTLGTFTGIKKDVSGVSFQLKPVSSGARFPVHVIVDDQTAKPVVVDDEGWYGGEQFATLKVDVTPGGGREGDEWRIFIRPTKTASKGQQFPTDDKGNLHARLAAPEVVVASLGMLGGEWTDGPVYLPSMVRIDTNSKEAGDFIDISAYRYVKLSAWLPDGVVSYNTQKISVFLEVNDGGPDANWHPYKAIPAGTVNDFAGPDGGPSIGKAGHVMVGEVEAHADELETNIPVRYRHARIRVQFANGPTDMSGPMNFVLWGFP